MRRNLIFLSTFLLFFFMKGQVSPETDVSKTFATQQPPTPESYKFATYGNLPVGLFTGAPDFTIPLIEFASFEISIPISLHYASNGIKIDDMNGAVGLGWRLLSAGVITRVIRDLPDDLSDDFGAGDVPDIASLGLNNPTVINYLDLVDQDTFDSEPDLYLANFAGQNLKFIIKRDGTVVQLDKSDFKIEPGFKITSPTGIVYEFNAKEQTKNSLLNAGMHGPESLNTTAWYLTKITDSKKNEITIEYYDKTYSATIAQSQSLAYTPPYISQSQWGQPLPNSGGSCPVICAETDYTILPSMGLIAQLVQVVGAGKQIKKISDSNSNYVLFSYTAQNMDVDRLSSIKQYSHNTLTQDFALSYEVTPNGRAFLSQLNNIHNQSKHSFTYYNPAGLPARLSLSRDKWGYYNAKNNSSLIPQVFESDDPQKVDYPGANGEVNKDVGYFGLLSSITYPTKGISNITYENHKTKGEIKVPGQESTASLQSLNDAFTTLSTSEKTITPVKSGYITLYVGCGLNLNGDCGGHPSLETNKQRASIRVLDNAGAPMPLWTKGVNGAYNYIGTDFSVTQGNSSTIFVSASKNEPLRVQLSANWFCADASAHVVYPSSEDQYVIQDILLGGYRIKSITDSPLSGLPLTKNYSYLKEDGTYSIHQPIGPLFRTTVHNKSICGESALCQEPFDIFYHVITSSNLNQYSAQRPPIFYSRVTEQSLGGGGKISHTFNVDFDSPPSPYGDEIAGSPWSNTGWQNGKVLLIEYFDSQEALQKKVVYNYNKKDQSSVFGLSVRKKHNKLVEGPMFPKYGHLDFSFYTNYSRFGYLESISSTDYIEGAPLLTQTQYDYANSAHYQLSSQKTTSPDLLVSKTNYQYAHEKANPYLISKNMVGIALQTTVEHTKNGISKTTLNSQTHYPISQAEAELKTSGLPLPIETVTKNLQSTALETKIQYTKYDPTNGNLLEFKEKDNLPVALIWGYNGTKLIAQINGASYTEVASLASGIITASNSDAQARRNNDETAFLNLLDAFRNHMALARFQVTTYSYDPLIGLRTRTPPSGERAYYHYDEANRLQSIKNAKGELLNEVKYHFKDLTP